MILIFNETAPIFCALLGIDEFSAIIF